MNKKLSIILTFVLFSIFFYSCADNGNFKPQVVKGVIDLRSWDFQKEVVSLDGDWEFYPYEFIEPGSIHLKKENHPVFLSVPGFWNDVIKEGEGYGTYRIRMLLQFFVLSISFMLFYLASFIKDDGVGTICEIRLPFLANMGII